MGLISSGEYDSFTVAPKCNSNMVYSYCQGWLGTWLRRDKTDLPRIQNANKFSDSATPQKVLLKIFQGNMFWEAVLLNIKMVIPWYYKLPCSHSNTCRYFPFLRVPQLLWRVVLGLGAQGANSENIKNTAPRDTLLKHIRSAVEMV